MSASMAIMRELMKQYFLLLNGLNVMKQGAKFRWETFYEPLPYTGNIEWDNQLWGFKVVDSDGYLLDFEAYAVHASTIHSPSWSIPNGVFTHQIYNIVKSDEIPFGFFKVMSGMENYDLMEWWWKTTGEPFIKLLRLGDLSLIQDTFLKLGKLVTPPTPSATTRGQMYRYDAGPTYADAIKYIKKRADDTYELLRLLDQEDYEHLIRVEVSADERSVAKSTTEIVARWRMPNGVKIKVWAEGGYCDNTTSEECFLDLYYPYGSYLIRATDLATAGQGIFNQQVPPLPPLVEWGPVSSPQRLELRLRNVGSSSHLMGGFFVFTYE